MVAITTEDVSLVGLVTFLACFQMARFAIKVGALRRKHKIDPPKIDGHPEFERGLRAQQNSVEWFAVFVVLMWVSAIFFNQVAAAVVGIGYIFGRQQYFSGYIADAKDRLPGFYTATNCLKAFLGMTVAGLAQSILYQYFKINLKGYVGL